MKGLGEFEALLEVTEIIPDREALLEAGRLFPDASLAEKRVAAQGQVLARLLGGDPRMLFALAKSGALKELIAGHNKKVGREVIQ
jgi:hypothetical protein